MVKIPQKGKNVSQIVIVMMILLFCLIQNDLFSQSQKDKVHQDFLSLMDSDDKTPIYYQIVQDREWLIILSDSLKIDNLLRGGCRIKDLHEVFQNFNFELLLEQKGLVTNLDKWEKKKLHGLNTKNNIPRNGNYVQYSIPLISGEWGTIRRQYFEDKELLEDSIIVYTRDNKEKWNQVCQLFLSMRFPSYTY